MSSPSNSTDSTDSTEGADRAAGPPESSGLDTEVWTVTAMGGAAPAELHGRAVPATVPGTVHTDLLAAGLIPDPYLDEVEADVAWVGRTPWRYTTTFVSYAGSPGEQVELVFAGLDTVCEVTLNGHHLGSPRNMHRTHRFDVAAALVDGTNTLVVDFAAQLDAAEQAAEALGPRVHVNAHPFNAIRKMACNFGWDWGPDLVTAGIWRSVRLDRWHTARLGDVRTLVTVDAEGTGRVEVHAPVVFAESPSAGPVTLAAELGGAYPVVGEVEATRSGEAVVVLEVPDAQLWWPRGYGEQPLSDLRISLRSGDIELENQTRRVGFRTVTLDVTPDEHGTPFAIHVNGRPIQIKGANWIPEDCFPHRMDRARYATRIADAVDAGLNLLRVWGGGIYESDDFYDLCDEQGLLVWQDVLLACAAYAEEPPLRDEILAELAEAAARLSSHASLAIWNGNNENLWGYVDWAWAPKLAGRTWGEGYYLDAFPRLLAELDPARPFSPGSPWSFDERIHPNDPSHGTTHEWDVWNQLDYTAYRASVPRFVSEFGYQGPPTWTTLTDAVHDSPLTPTSPGMLSHQKAEDGNGKLTRGLTPHLPMPQDIEGWHWAMQVQQARAVTYGIEHFRSWHPVCMGSVVWQLNDCWPVTSWAAVDSAGRRKPLWFALRRAYADRLMTIQPRGGHLALVLDNDTDEVWAARVRLHRTTFDGTERAMSSVWAQVPARGTETVRLADALVADVESAAEVLVAEVADGSATAALWFFAEDRELALTTGWGAQSVDRTSSGYAVHVTARTLQRDVTLLVDKVDPDATVDDAGVTILPGRRHTFFVSSAKNVDPQRFLEPSVLRTTNQLVAAPTRRPGQPHTPSHPVPPAEQESFA